MVGIAGGWCLSRFFSASSGVWAGLRGDAEEPGDRQRAQPSLPLSQGRYKGLAHGSAIQKAQRGQGDLKCDEGKSWALQRGAGGR